MDSNFNVTTAYNCIISFFFGGVNLIYTKYNLGASQLDGILHTNIQNGKGYCFFEEIDLIFPVESDTDLFLERGRRVRVMYLESEVVGKSKDSKNEESEPLERFEDSSIAALEQRLIELLEECCKLYQEIQDLKKNCKNIKKGD